MHAIIIFVLKTCFAIGYYFDVYRFKFVLTLGFPWNFLKVLLKYSKIIESLKYIITCRWPDITYLVN